MKRFGWIPDKPDKRDWQYKAPLRYTLPPSVDLRPACTPIEDQGNLGSCVAFACIGALEYLDAKDLEWSDYSQLFTYYNCRVLGGTVNEDSGSYLRDGIKALNDWGACHSETWPYITSQFTVKPPDNAYSEAVNYKAVQYYRIPDPPVDLGAVKSALAEGYPVVYGFWVFENLYRMGEDAILPELLDTDDFLGGHAVMLVGYDEAKQLFTVRNSWGTSWGIDGYFYMPYDFLSRFGSDFWVLQKVSNVDATPEPIPEPPPAPTPDPTPTPPPAPTPDPAPKPWCPCAGLWKKLGLWTG